MEGGATFQAWTGGPPPAQSIDQYVSVDELSIRDQPGGKEFFKLKLGDKIQLFS